MSLRIGNGFDVHRLEEGLTFTLGGIVIEHHKGMVAHSDGDVLLHAICDALLGAAGLGDIGNHFPDNSDKFKGIDSKVLLKMTNDMINMEGYSIVNIDSVVCLQNPKINKYINSMRKTISGVLQINPADISIKATTTERLGFIGNEEGISASAVCLIEKV